MGSLGFLLILNYSLSFSFQAGSASTTTVLLNCWLVSMHLNGPCLIRQGHTHKQTSPWRQISLYLRLRWMVLSDNALKMLKNIFVSFEKSLQNTALRFLKVIFPKRVLRATLKYLRIPRLCGLNRVCQRGILWLHFTGNMLF